MNSVAKYENEINEFINALQLSIESTIERWINEDDDLFFSIFFSKVCKNDFGLELFEKLNLGKWNDEHNAYKIQYSDKLAAITAFLMLSRLNLDNIKKLAETKAEYRDLANQMGLNELKNIVTTVHSIEQAKKIIFDKINEKGMTIRQLSQKTGLSQTAISNFKAGNDIRLKNLLEILRALGVEMRIE